MIVVNTPRASTYQRFDCNAPDDVFAAEFEAITPENQAIINKQNGIPCEGGGRPGTWCNGCHWAGGSGTQDDLDDIAL